MLPLSIRGLIRFDIEDFLTKESDEALGEMLEIMDRYQMPGSYGMVGKKALALRERGAEHPLSLLRAKPSLGFHSTSHSEHPTISEELAELDYDAGVQAFVRRERRGVDMVSEIIKEPVYFTQPGGNWVPHAVDALPQLGIDIFFSDAWNSYLVNSPKPFWYGTILHLSPPVVTPRPFLMNMPDNLPGALKELEKALSDHVAGDLVMVMLHPTELISTKFWDAVNFWGGATIDPLRPAPLRSPNDRQNALKAFDAYVNHARKVDGIEWLDVLKIKQQIKPLEPTLVNREDLEESLSRQGLGPLKLHTGVFLTAAEALWALAYFIVHPDQGRVEVPVLRAPKVWFPDQDTGKDAIARSSLRSAGQYIIEITGQTGCVPDRVKTANGSLSLERFLFYGLTALRDQSQGDVRLTPVPLTFLSYVKDPKDLHWDWPIFPPGFEPFQLWNDTRRLAWSLKPAEWRSS